MPIKEQPIDAKNDNQPPRKDDRMIVNQAVVEPGDEHPPHLGDEYKMDTDPAATDKVQDESKDHAKEHGLRNKTATGWWLTPTGQKVQVSNVEYIERPLVGKQTSSSIRLHLKSGSTFDVAYDTPEAAQAAYDKFPNA